MPVARLILITTLIVVGICTRLIPHPPNFTAIGAAAILSGAILGKKYQCWFVPLTSMLVSDLFIGFHSLMPIVYLSLIVMVAVSRLLTPRSSPLTYGGLGVLSSLFFFVTTNFAVWMGGTLYPKTIDGFVACYVASLPFLGNMLAADLIYLTLALSVIRLGERISPAIEMAA